VAPGREPGACLCFPLGRSLGRLLGDERRRDHCRGERSPPRGPKPYAAGNTDDYHVRLDAPCEWPDVLRASQSVAVAGKALLRGRPWPRHADHQELLSRTEPQRPDTSRPTGKTQGAGASTKTPQFRWTKTLEADFQALRDFAGHAVPLPDPWPDDLSRPVFLVPEDSEHFGWSVRCDEIYMDFRPRRLQLPSLLEEEVLDGFGSPAVIGTRPFKTISKGPPPPRAERPEPSRHPVLAVAYPDGTLEINGYRVTRARLLQIGRSLRLFDLAPDWL